MPSNSKIELRLVRAPNDPPQFSTDYQTEIRVVIHAMRKDSIEVQPEILSMDSIDAHGGLSGLLTIIGSTIASSGVAAAIGNWLTSRNGRKLRIKVGDIEVEGNSQKDVDRLLREAQALKTQNDTEKKIHEP